jgi:hypothetical protein
MCITRRLFLRATAQLAALLGVRFPGCAQIEPPKQPPNVDTAIPTAIPMAVGADPPRRYVYMPMVSNGR